MHSYDTIFHGVIIHLSKLFRAQYVQSALLLFILTLFYILLYKIYIPRVNAFGCFDDCFNFMGGLFITQGKEIFTDFFFNHQPGMAFLSALVHIIFDPQSIPELILRHRQVMMLISLAMNAMLLVRFGRSFIIPIIIFELTKFYVFGDRFLAEGLITYFLIYQAFTTLQALFHNKIKKIDVFIVPIFAWVTLFFREPLIPLAGLLFASYLFALRKNKRNLITSLITFGVLGLIFSLVINVPDYIFNVYTINRSNFQEELAFFAMIGNYAKSAFYPLYLFFSPDSWTHFRVFLAFNSGILISSFIFLITKKKHLKEIVFVIGILVISNLRPVEPTRTFYEAFHIIPWYGLFLFSSVYFLEKIFRISKNAGIIFLILIVLSFLQFITNKDYFAYEEIDTTQEYFTQYSAVMEAGTIIRNLSEPSDTLFVDGFDDLVMWEAKRPSPYEYTWYTSFMPHIEKYSSAKSKMFQNSPPDFYYGRCMIDLIGDKHISSEILVADYVQLKSNNRQVCILIKRSKFEQISEEQKNLLIGTNYSLPAVMQDSTNQDK